MYANNIPYKLSKQFNYLPNFIIKRMLPPTSMPSTVQSCWRSTKSCSNSSSTTNRARSVWFAACTSRRRSTVRTVISCPPNWAGKHVHVLHMCSKLTNNNYRHSQRHVGPAQADRIECGRRAILPVRAGRPRRSGPARLLADLRPVYPQQWQLIVMHRSVERAHAAPAAVSTRYKAHPISQAATSIPSALSYRKRLERIHPVAIVILVT